MPLKKNKKPVVRAARRKPAAKQCESTFEAPACCETPAAAPAVEQTEDQEQGC